MAVPIDTGVDFLQARLHGLWSSGFHGNCLQQLVQSTTPELLQQNLRAYGIEASSREEFHLAIRNRELRLLESVMRLVDEKTAQWYRAFTARGWCDNVKILLHDHMMAEDAAERPVALGKIGAQVFPLEELRRARSDEEFISLLPLPPGMPKSYVEKALEWMRQSQAYMQADSLLDGCYYRRLMEAARDCPRPVARVVQELQAEQLDLMNLLALLRNRRTYHLDAGEMSAVWLAGGKRLSPSKLAHLMEETDMGRIAGELPLAMRRHLEQGDRDLHKVESGLWQELHAHAVRCFRNCEEPLNSVAAYPFLLRFETWNLGRLYECVHFAVPPEKIAAMMVG